MNKYEGNDLYKEYNKKEHKAKTEDDLNLTKKTTMQTAMHIEENENGMNIEENKENHNENDEKIKNEININNNINNNNKINNTTDDLKLKSPNILEKKEEEDIEMEDKTLNLDKTDWVKAELYNYTYQLPTGKNKKAKSERISMPRIIYINKNWSNAQLYDCINDILDGAKKEMPEIKQMWYIDLKETTINLDQINKNKEGNIYEQFHKLNTHPLMVQYLRYFNFNKDGGIKKILEIEKEKRNLIKNLSLNINFAPVADYTENSSSYIYNRTLGQSITETEKYISEVVKEANKDNFTTCLKHFPGYGGNTDTHKGIAIDKRELKEFKEKDFKPFIAGINQNVPMIMVSHNIIEKIDSKYPSSISAKIHKILREELKYTGLIVTDDISMGAITQFGSGQSIGTVALLSGVDIIMSSNNTQNYDDVVKAYDKGIIDIEQIDIAVTRILACK